MIFIKFDKKKRYLKYVTLVICPIRRMHLISIKADSGMCFEFNLKHFTWRTALDRPLFFVFHLWLLENDVGFKGFLQNLFIIHYCFIMKFMVFWRVQFPKTHWNSPFYLAKNSFWVLFNQLNNIFFIGFWSPLSSIESLERVGQIVQCKKGALLTKICSLQRFVLLCEAQ